MYLTRSPVAGTMRGVLWCALAAGLLPLASSAQDAPPATAPPSAEAALPPRPLLYMFEHVQLRESAFLYDQDIQFILAYPRQATDSMVRLFSKASFRVARLPGIEADAVVQMMTNEVGTYLGQITIDTIRRSGYTINLFGMPPPEHSAEAYYTAIVYKDSEPKVEGQPAPSTRYITFERTHVEGRVFALGEWDVNGQHSTLGFGDREPTVNDFLASVYSMLGIAGPRVGTINDLILMRWLDAYGAAWESGDADAAAALFGANASYRESPYADPVVGRDAIRSSWAAARAAESDVEFESEILSVSGMTAVARWSASFGADAEPAGIDGIFVLEFEADGTVGSLREWRQSRESE